MRWDLQLSRFVELLKREDIDVSYFIIYNKRGRILINNRILLTVQGRMPDQAYYRTFQDIGFRYERGGGEEEMRAIDRCIDLWIRFFKYVLPDTEFVYLDRDYRPDLIRVEDVFPFASYEQKEPRSELLIRYTYKCNQGCEFCSAPPALPDPSHNYIKLLIKRAADIKTAFDITFTGGEPTVRKGLADIVRWTLKNTDSDVRIQTNAVAFSSERFITPFPLSKRLSFFVSLHSLTEREYDTITSSKGMLNKAIKGLTRILRRGYFTVVNIVLNKYNYKGIEKYFKTFYDLFGEYRPVIHISTLILPEYRVNIEKYMVSYKEILRYLLPVMEKYNIPLDSVLSSTHASVPLCFLPERYRLQSYKSYIPNPYETGYEDLKMPWVKKEGCRLCKYDRYCLGVPNIYYRRFGIDNV